MSDQTDEYDVEDEPDPLEVSDAQMERTLVLLDWHEQLISIRDTPIEDRWEAHRLNVAYCDWVMHLPTCTEPSD